MIQAAIQKRENEFNSIADWMVQRFEAVFPSLSWIEFDRRIKTICTDDKKDEFFSNSTVFKLQSDCLVYAHLEDNYFLVIEPYAYLHNSAYGYFETVENNFTDLDVELYYCLFDDLKKKKLRFLRTESVDGNPEFYLKGIVQDIKQHQQLGVN